MGLVKNYLHSPLLALPRQTVLLLFELSLRGKQNFTLLEALLLEFVVLRGGKVSLFLQLRVERLSFFINLPL